MSARSKPTDREVRRQLYSLVAQVEQCLTAIDKTMQGPSTSDRGKCIAQISNVLEMQKDMAKRFGLGITSSKPLKVRP